MHTRGRRAERGWKAGCGPFSGWNCCGHRLAPRVVWLVLAAATCTISLNFVTRWSPYRTWSLRSLAPRPGISPRGAPSGRPQPLLVPRKEGPQWWDARNSASPVVKPPSQAGGPWRMWYYGRAGAEWSKGLKAFLPTGRIGCAESDDGLKWRRRKGPLEGGACLDPSEEGFDCVHVGVGDVVELPNGTLWMYYFGGGLDGLPNEGIRMQIGLATSDDGLTWHRAGDALLTPSGEDFDALFVAWPRVLPPWQTRDVLGLSGKWYMTYHTAQFGPEGLRWTAGAALSEDGLVWSKVGPILGPSGGGWDALGVGVRHVLVKDGALTMLYEAVDEQGDHAVGLAVSSDGLTWRRQEVPGRAAGGPVLRKGEDGDWDSRVVGTPYAVAPVGDAPWRLYYVGEAKGSPGLRIGVAECYEDDLLCWRKRGAEAMDLPKDAREGLYKRVFEDAQKSKVAAAPSSPPPALDLDLPD
ncbi:unnamed protein product [Durusdinium trenchii]|uniref:Glycosyl hydrolase family 32 N-terminal domain-containing protein n=1 Tax=Durusdinium trenchii TaxID=1381693 RepID=A0ABP0J1B7_9DINO